MLFLGFLVILFAFLCLDIKCNVIKIDLHGALRVMRFAEVKWIFFSANNCITPLANIVGISFSPLILARQRQLAVHSEKNLFSRNYWLC